MPLFSNNKGLVSNNKGLAGGIIGGISNIVTTKMANDANRDIMNQNNQFNAEQAQLARDFNATQAQEQRDWTEQQYMEHQSMQAKVAEYEAAGLNPMGLAGDMSGSVGSGSAATGDTATSSGNLAMKAADPFATYMEMRNLARQERLADSEVDMQKAMATMYTAQADKAKNEIHWNDVLNEDKHALNDNQFKLLSAQIGVEEATKAGMVLDNIVKEFNSSKVEEMYMLDKSLKEAETALRRAQARNEEEQVQVYKAQIAHYQSMIRYNDDAIQISLMNAYTRQNEVDNSFTLGSRNASTNERNADTNRYSADIRDRAQKDLEAFHKCLRHNMTANTIIGGINNTARTAVQVGGAFATGGLSTMSGPRPSQPSQSWGSQSLSGREPLFDESYFWYK